ncbi:MAG: threonylcarbamoyl-AMP synthase, partial [Bdellovibrionales bacterium]|nr:threonylcarbamoyl-AMP synthase [Bdellovibrionales bacterium]
MRTEILSPHELPKAIAALNQGAVVGMPTETVYGLAAVFSDANACLKVFETKSRPTFDPLIVHVSLTDLSVPFLSQLAELGLVNLREIPENLHSKIELLLRSFWPGPLTIVLPRGNRVLDIVTSGLNTVALRSPKHPVAQELLKAVGQPLVAPSANRFGRISPTTANDVVTELGGLIPFVIDGGRCEIGLESTVVMPLPDGTLRYLRPGAAAKHELEIFWRGPVTPFYDAEETAKDSQGLKAPGRLPSHYAPKTQLHILPKALEEMSESDWQGMRELAQDSTVLGVLCFR